jgi:hypothetical protein
VEEEQLHRLAADVRGRGSRRSRPERSRSARAMSSRPGSWRRSSRTTRSRSSALPPWRTAGPSMRRLPR